jgi:hypothetical protein
MVVWFYLPMLAIVLLRPRGFPEELSLADEDA